MLLSTASPMGTVMLIFGAFWVTVVIVLLIAVGALLGRRERLLRKHGHGDSAHH
jgi:hypothetical protein